MRIVIADDDPLARRLTKRTLEQAGYEVVTFDNGRAAAEYLATPGSPRLALLDWVMPGLDGPRVCRVIRKIAGQPYIYIILLTSKGSKDDLVAGLEAGADDFVTKPCDAHELKARLRTGQRILALQDRLLHDARHDSLTQLPNRAHFLTRLTQCVQRSKEDLDYRFGVLFVDLDRFKSVNDRFGHSAGDELITQIAERLNSSIRGKQAQLRATDNDIVARLGGDEFTVLLDGLRDASEANKIADRLRNELTQPFPLLGHQIHITASIGVSVSVAGYNNAEDILRDADCEMYRAKAAAFAAVPGDRAAFL